MDFKLSQKFLDLRGVRQRWERHPLLPKRNVL